MAKGSGGTRGAKNSSTTTKQANTSAKKMPIGYDLPKQTVFVDSKGNVLPPSKMSANDELKGKYNSLAKRKEMYKRDIADYNERIKSRKEELSSLGSSGGVYGSMLKDEIKIFSSEVKEWKAKVKEIEKEQYELYRRIK